MKEPLKDVLVFTPVYQLAPETIRAVFRLEFDGALTWIFQEDNKEDQDGRANILHQYRRGRELFLRGPYDAMMVIEADIVPPQDTITKLAALDVDCAYGVYVFRPGNNIINVYERYPQKPGRGIPNMGQSLSVKPQLLRRAMKVGKIPCSGGGLGCVLIRRHVLDEIDFRMDTPTGAHCDTWFNKDVLAAGFEQMAHFGVICGHKRAELGEIIYPDLPMRKRLEFRS
jgi:hypothetical protein